MPGVERDEETKRYVKLMATGVEVFVTTDLGDPDVTIATAAYPTNRTAIAETAATGLQRIIEVIQAHERCQHCVRLDRPCHVYCEDCERERTLCYECKILGFHRWNNEDRACFECMRSRDRIITQCIRGTVHTLVGDGANFRPSSRSWQACRHCWDSNRF